MLMEMFGVDGKRVVVGEEGIPAIPFSVYGSREVHCWQKRFRCLGPYLEKAPNDSSQQRNKGKERREKSVSDS
jgi:hypothetical protein